MASMGEALEERGFPVQMRLIRNRKEPSEKGVGATARKVRAKKGKKGRAGRMDVVFHLGAHGTDEGRLVRTLLANSETLAGEGVAVPRPRHARPIIREAARILQAGQASAAFEQALLDELTELEQPERLILANDNFLGAVGQAVGAEQLYPLASRRAAVLASLFPSARIEFSIGIRNPATFIPAIFRATKEREFSHFIREISLEALRWSELAERILDAVPDATVRIWANEDTPYIWPEIVRAVAGVGADVALEGLDDFLAELLTEEGKQRLTSYLASHPPLNESQRRRIVAAFLERFPREEAVMEDIELPGWTPELVEELTELYEEDLYTIARMDEVLFHIP